jgi:hypothetical protein
LGSIPVRRFVDVQWGHHATCIRQFLVLTLEGFIESYEIGLSFQPTEIGYSSAKVSSGNIYTPLVIIPFFFHCREARVYSWCM